VCEVENENNKVTKIILSSVSLSNGCRPYVVFVVFDDICSPFAGIEFLCETEVGGGINSESDCVEGSEKKFLFAFIEEEFSRVVMCRVSFSLNVVIVIVKSQTMRFIFISSPPLLLLPQKTRIHPYNIFYCIETGLNSCIITRDSCC
jgi:hypothetical protein